MRILLIEDDREAANYLIKGLKQSGHNVDHAADGKNGLFMAIEMRYELIILDRMLPGFDGLAILKTLRNSGQQTPVLILSALGEVEDRVTGLQAGGDDYLVKPYAFSELLARIEALTRRVDPKIDQTILYEGDLELNRLSHRVNRDGKHIDLQPREFRLLEFLMQRVGQVVTRTMLLEGVWDYHFDPQTNVIDVHISRLRNKIDKNFDSPLLHTVRGAGYRLQAADKPE